MPEFAQRAIAHIRAMQHTMAAAGENVELYNVHGHYADAAEAAALISRVLGCDMVATGHSLGRNKLEHLLKLGAWPRAVWAQLLLLRWCYCIMHVPEPVLQATAQAPM